MNNLIKINWFYKMLDENGLIINNGKMVDASFHEALCQRNSREKNQTINEGDIPESFKENPNRLSHNDTDAR